MPLMFVFSHFYTHNFSLLYMCHLYLSSQGYNQADSEETVCGFIGNVITGQYDEYGYIYLDSDDYAKDNANNSNAATKEGVTIGQIFGLLASILSCGVLMVWVFFLHRRLSRKALWRPNRGGAAASAGKVSRQNSGIVMGRSRSGGSYHGGQMA